LAASSMFGGSAHQKTPSRRISDVPVRRVAKSRWWLDISDCSQHASQVGWRLANSRFVHKEAQFIVDPLLDLSVHIKIKKKRKSQIETDLVVFIGYAIDSRQSSGVGVHHILQRFHFTIARVNAEHVVAFAHGDGAVASHSVVNAALLVPRVYLHSRNIKTCHT